MEQRRISERIKVNDELRILIKYNETDSATCARFRVMSKSDNFVVKQLEKLQHHIEERSEKITFLEHRLEKINTGELDEELKAIIDANVAEIKLKTEATKVKKLAEKTIKESDQQSSKSYYAIERQGDRMNKTWYFDAALNYFNKANNSIPDYMKRELSRMPSNTGYIWKGVYCFGERPANSGTFSVTDNRKGMKIIHVWDKKYFSIYHKDGKNEEVLISQVLKKPKY
jgi:hypothetical protein